MTMTRHEEVIDPEIVRSSGEWIEVIRDDLGRAVEGIVSAGKHLIAAKADVNHGEWLPMLKEIGISHTTAKQLMTIGGNPAVSNGRNCDFLPTAARALYELSRLAPEDIETGIESGHITPDMTIRDAKTYVNPVTGEISDAPTQEEQKQRFEEAIERGRAEGTIPPPLTQEEMDAGDEQFVRSVTGEHAPRERPEPLTPDDKFAKALNAVGAAIRINHYVNESLLTEDGWNVLRALGLR